MWINWSRTGPFRTVEKKAPWYNVARFTINENFGDATNLGDRTLVLWIG